MKKTLAVALALAFVLAVAVPAFAQSMTHTAKYDFVDAEIDLERQMGHICNTGAELKYTVKGSAAEFMSEKAVAMSNNKITVSKDEAAWVAGATPLTVTSVIELCMPAKHEYTLARNVWDGEEWVSRVMDSGVMSVDEVYAHLYGMLPLAYTLDADGDYELAGSSLFDMAWAALSAGTFDADSLDTLLLWDADAWAAFYGRDLPGYYSFTPKALTKQLWAVQVQSDPGFSGNLNQTWEATNGGWDTNTVPGAELTGAPNTWGFILDDDYGFTADIGEDFVGMYFNMDQHARTSQGTLKRFIDISSPWSHAYVSEDATVTGRADVQEAFSMVNLGPGSDISTEWYELF